MRWLEIITVRSAGREQRRSLDEFLKQIPKFAAQNAVDSVQVFTNATVEGDLSIHLHWNSRRAECQKSSQGLGLAQTLREHGLVNHSVWIEKDGTPRKRS